MSSIQEFDTAQLAAARTAAWHQGGEGSDALLTIEAAREWINAHGLVLFAPRTLQLPAPAPSLVEATLGAANDAPSAAQSATARNLVSRLVSDGSVVPLNLLGVPGDVPDFVVSAQVFSYIFTLRGDKGWKLPPATSGAIAVSPLGLHIYEVLAEKGAMTAAELANELGREVTETAIMRGLSELWSQLRVLPLLSQGEGATLWELTTRRFTKAIKAGANAGQPTALSALISLYLGQVFVATEEEIATFLSPLTARSRVREVLRALTSARQLETVVSEGKTLLLVPGGLPEFAAKVVDGVAAEGDESGEAAELPKPKKVGTGRISSFTSDKAEKDSFRGKPAKSFGAAKKSYGAAKKSFGKSAGGARPTSRFGAGAEGKPDRERRPFKREGAEGGKPAFARSKPAFAKDKPSFTKPWDEEKRPRAAAAPKDSFTKFRKPSPEDREPLGPREQAGLPEERRTPVRKATESFQKRTFDGSPVERKPYAKKSFGDRPAARPYAKKAFGDKPSFGAKRPYTPRGEEGGERPAFKPRSYERRDGAAPFARKAVGDRPYAKKAFGDKPSFGAKRPYTPRSEEGGERPAFKPRTFDRGDKPAFGAKRPYVRKTEGDRPFVKRAPKPKYQDDGPIDGPPVERTIPRRPFKPRAADHDKRQFTKAPWAPPAESGEGKRPYKPRAAGGGFGGAKKSFGAKKPFGSKPGGFGAKRGAAGSAGKPTWRKKPEAGA